MDDMQDDAVVGGDEVAADSVEEATEAVPEMEAPEMSEETDEAAA